MRRALARARTMSGRTAPNPAVGAVVFQGERVLGQGATRPPPGAHAEVVAVERARRRHGARALRGAEMAVTLEPCAHTGRTGPCTEVLREAGLRRIWVGCRDPHPLVSGRGIRALRRAGIQVESGVLEPECEEHHRGFLALCRRGRPWVTLKLASSLDGRIATARGESRWITGEEARKAVHRLRARVDAVAVGSGTALADDPVLTARSGSRVLHRPVRVLVDGRLRVPVGSRLFRSPDPERTWVLHRPGARGRSARAATGARLLEVPGDGAHLDLDAAMRRLGAEGLGQVLVEGGGELAAALLRAGLVDEIQWFLAPILLGAEGRPALGALEVERLRDATRLDVLSSRRVGEDVLVSGQVRSPTTAGRGAGRGPGRSQARGRGQGRAKR